MPPVGARASSARTPHSTHRRARTHHTTRHDTTRRDTTRHDATRRTRVTHPTVTRTVVQSSEQSIITLHHITLHYSTVVQSSPQSIMRSPSSTHSMPDAASVEQSQAPCVMVVRSRPWWTSERDSDHTRHGPRPAGCESVTIVVVCSFRGALDPQATTHCHRSNYYLVGEREGDPAQPHVVERVHLSSHAPRTRHEHATRMHVLRTRERVIPPRPRLASGSIGRAIHASCTRHEHAQFTRHAAIASHRVPSHDDVARREEGRRRARRRRRRRRRRLPLRRVVDLLLASTSRHVTSRQVKSQVTCLKASLSA